MVCTCMDGGVHGLSLDRLAGSPFLWVRVKGGACWCLVAS